MAKIATTKVIPAIQRGRWSSVAALASRDEAKAREAARTLGIPRAYGSYDELLASPDVDAVYIPLPNHLHAPWTARAARRGKHVLCEKPIALTAAEARALVEVRDETGVKIQEAFMVRTHPQWTTARALVGDGRIGDVRAVLGAFSYFNRDPRNIRNVPEFGGGALMDIGCYLVNTSRFIFGREPSRVMGLIERDPDMRVDRMTSMLFDFDPGHGVATCSTQLVPFQRIQILGTAGRIEIEVPFNAPPDRPCRIRLERLGDAAAARAETIEIETCDQYTIQADLFARAILEGTDVPAPLEDAVQNMACIEAVFRSASSGRWESPE